jgi:hypothetical protein
MPLTLKNPSKKGNSYRWKDTHLWTPLGVPLPKGS